MKKQGKFIVGGHVQGVGFRFFVYRRARELNLSGFAENLYDGNVEVIAEGEEIALKELQKFLKDGPSRSHVDYVHAEFTEFSDSFTGFDIK